MRLTVTGLADGRVLRLQRCGPLCRTAQLEAQWDDSQLPANGRLEVSIEQSGRYYFWVAGGPGETGGEVVALTPEVVERVGRTLRLHYAGGPEVRAASLGADGAADRNVSPAAAADRCRSGRAAGRFEEAAGAARLWIDLAGNPTERAEAHYCLGRTLFDHALDTLHPFARDFRRPNAPRPYPDTALGEELLGQAIDALAKTKDAPRDHRRDALLHLADARVRLGQFDEALASLDEYTALGGDDPLAGDLGCWANLALDRAAEVALATGEREGKVRAPVKVHAPPPRMTEEARRLGVEGTMLVTAFIDERGRVVCARAITPLPAGLGRVAVETVKEWRFEPATLDGEPTFTVYNLSVNFTLHKRQPAF